MLRGFEFGAKSPWVTSIGIYLANTGVYQILEGMLSHMLPILQAKSNLLRLEHGVWWNTPLDFGKSLFMIG